jgi:hypothetical protein
VRQGIEAGGMSERKRLEDVGAARWPRIKAALMAVRDNNEGAQ